MRVLIDTSSLLALVRYYIPFDKENSLKNFIKKKIDEGIILVIDKVFDESKFTSRGTILNDLDFLKDKARHFKTDELLPSQNFFKILDNQLCYASQKSRLNTAEYELSRNKYLDSADAKLILYCFNASHSLMLDKPILVTEETNSENDNKLFKKLPSICSLLEIDSCNLPTLLKDHFKINLSQYLK
jgi:hypothetical protein